jgi:UDPglucose--hexose-1-phosphate uridylyltransferase
MHPQDSEWTGYLLANKYPAFGGNEPMVVENLGPVFTQAPASGIHEVMVFSDDHHGSLADLSPEYAASAMIAIRDRMREHSTMTGMRYSQAIVNHGREAGASMAHPHGQLLGIPFVPGEIHEEMAGFARFEGGNLLVTTFEAEVSVGHRVVYADDDVAVLCPFWSGAAYEMLILPTSLQPHLLESSDDMVAAVGKAIRLSLVALRKQLGDVPYNMVVHSAPYRSSATFQWHVHILPKLATRAGFELGTGVLINVVPPEQAAANLRDSLPH